MQLRDYQQDAAYFLLAHDKALALGSVGSGKTAIALRAIEAKLTALNGGCFLVLAPKRVCTEVWPQEAKLWAPALVISTVADGWRPKLGASGIVVTNYEQIPKLVAEWPELSQRFDGVVFDELTRLKNPSGVRFKALCKSLEGVPIRWGLTGSFTSNGLEDVFGQCKIVDETLLGRGKTRFMQKYFMLMNRDFGLWEPKPGSLTQVMSAIKPATIVLENKAHTDALPPLHIIKIHCNLGNRKPYNEMRYKYVIQPFPDEHIVAKNAAVVSAKLRQLANGFVYGVNKLAVWFSRHKFERLDEILQENQHANTIVVYEHEATLDELKCRYPNAVTIDEKNAIADWNAGHIELLLIHPASAGHGLNLQFGGHQMVFLAPPWSLEMYEQVIGRLHRSGQTNPVWVYVLVGDKTVDELAWHRLQDKKTMDDIATQYLKMY